MVEETKEIAESEMTEEDKAQVDEVAQASTDVSEEASEENAWIANDDSTWDEQWMEHFGGVDNPEGRNFIPKENPYYFALPYTDFDENGRKQNIKKVYWYEQYQDRLTDTSFSIIKNRWAEIKNKEKDKTCYGQWEDAGPSEYDDTDYVFGTAQPKYDVGIDLSPDLAKCLGIDGKGGWLTIQSQGNGQKLSPQANLFGGKVRHKDFLFYFLQIFFRVASHKLTN